MLREGLYSCILKWRDGWFQVRTCYNKNKAGYCKSFFDKGTAKCNALGGILYLCFNIPIWTVCKKHTSICNLILNTILFLRRKFINIGKNQTIHCCYGYCLFNGSIWRIFILDIFQMKFSELCTGEYKWMHSSWLEKILWLC